MIRAMGFVVVGVARSSKVLARIRDRVRAGLCLAFEEDGTTPCNRKAVKCGNCDRCNQRMRREAAKLPDDASRHEYRRECLRLGLTLEQQEVREFKTDDTFARLRMSIAESTVRS